MKKNLTKSLVWLGVAALAATLAACDARVNVSDPPPGPVVNKETTVVNPPAEKKTETNTTIIPGGGATETKTETTNP